MSSLFRESVASYKRAQSCLPAEDVMSESDKQLNAQLHKSLMQSLTDALKAARAGANSQPEVAFIVHDGLAFHPIEPLNIINKTGKRPWERAMSLAHDLQERGIRTSSVRSWLYTYKCPTR